MINYLNDKLLNRFKGQRLTQSLAFLLLVVIGVTVAQDYLRAMLNQSAFYLSESLLYTTFWACFWPVGWMLFFTLKKRNGISVYVLMPVAVVLHLLLTPFIIWAVSGLFFDHTYGFIDVGVYTMAEQLYVLLVVYTGLVAGMKYLLRRVDLPGVVVPGTGIDDTAPVLYMKQILVTTGKTSMLLDVDSILYISAASPYVCIHLENRKHLYNHSLKHTADSLDPQQFLRIHKSTLVNLKMVSGYTSRLNGDYDLALLNGEVLRLSRNYRAAFTDRFGK